MRRILASTIALIVVTGANAWANDYSQWDCTRGEFVTAFKETMNSSPEFTRAGLKVVSITDPATVAATAQKATCRAMFKFGSGEAVDETFMFKDGPDGRLVWSYKPTEN